MNLLFHILHNEFSFAKMSDINHIGNAKQYNKCYIRCSIYVYPKMGHPTVLVLIIAVEKVYSYITFTNLREYRPVL